MIDAANRIAEVYRQATGVSRINYGIRALDEVTAKLSRLGVLSEADLAAWQAYKRRAGYHTRLRGEARARRRRFKRESYWIRREEHSRSEVEMETQVKEQEIAQPEVKNGAGASVGEMRRKAGRVRRYLVDTVDKKLHAAKRTVRRGAYGVQDSKAELAGRIRKAPFRSVMLSAAVGSVVGFVAMLMGRRRKD